MTIYIANAFSLGMVPRQDLTSVRCEACKAPAGAEAAQAVSVVGHADTAKVLGVALNRATVTLSQGDVMYVAQLQGGRLPEGATTLPAGFSFAWVRVTL